MNENTEIAIDPDQIPTKELLRRQRVIRAIQSRVVVRHNFCFDARGQLPRDEHNRTFRRGTHATRQ